MSLHPVGIPQGHMRINAPNNNNNYPCIHTHIGLPKQLPSGTPHSAMHLCRYAPKYTQRYSQRYTLMYTHMYTHMNTHLYTHAYYMWLLLVNPYGFVYPGIPICLPPGYISRGNGRHRLVCLPQVYVPIGIPVCIYSVYSCVHSHVGLG